MPENELERRRQLRKAFQEGSRYGTEVTVLFFVAVVGLIYWATA